MQHLSSKTPLRWRKRLRRLRKSLNKLERALPKLQAEFEAAEAKVSDLTSRLIELEAAHEASRDDAAELSRLEEQVKQAKIALDEVTAGTAALKAKEASLQEA